MALVGLALLVVAGCSGSKVTTKIVCGIVALSDSYHRVGAVHDSCDATGEGCRRSTFSVPPGVRRSDDMAMAVSPNTEQLPQANSHRADWRRGYRHTVAMEPVEDKAGYDRAFAE